MKLILLILYMSEICRVVGFQLVRLLSEWSISLSFVISFEIIIICRILKNLPWSIYTSSALFVEFGLGCFPSVLEHAFGPVDLSSVCWNQELTQPNLCVAGYLGPTGGL